MPVEAFKRQQKEKEAKE
jgi:hypothetical protein